jgi:hypothetical protein
LNELEKYDAACATIAQCKSIFETKEFHDKAAAIEVYARAAKNEKLEADAKAIRMHAIRRLGQIMEAQPKAKGAREPGTNRGSTRGVETPASLTEIGIDKDLAKKARKLSKMSNKEFDDAISNVRKPEPKRKKSKSPGVAAKHNRIVELFDQGVPRPDIAAEVGVGERMVGRVLEVEEARRENEPIIDPASLSATAQKKLETVIRQHKRHLDAQFSQTVKDRIKEVLDDWLPDYEQKLREAEQVINTYEGLMSRADFRKIWGCLHPDRGASKTMLAEAFDLFAKHERVLVKKEKEQRQPKMPFPQTYAEAMAMKQAVREQRRAQRASNKSSAVVRH